MLGSSCRRKMLTTDASLTGWGAILEGRSRQGLWKNHHLSWHINRLEMLAVFLALKNFLADLRGHHVLVRSDNTSVVSYINHQWGLRSHPLCKLAFQILLWSQGKLLSLRTTFIPGALNIGANILFRQGLRPGEWRLHPEVVELIWKEFGQAQVDLFVSQETSHCPLWFSLTHPTPLGLDAMTQTWPRLRLYAFPPIALLPGVLERVRGDRVPLLLIAPRGGQAEYGSQIYYPFSMGFLWSSRQEGPSVPSGGLDISPPSRTMETVGLASERLPGISFPQWYAEACSSHQGADMGLGHCPARPFPGSHRALRGGTGQVFDLLAISSLKRIDLQALSIAPSCLEFALG